MKRNCQRCSNSEFEAPEFTSSEKQLLSELKAKNQTLQVVLKIKSWYGLGLVEAKFALMHINLIHGKCHRCNFENLKGEYTTCPKWKSLNFNWEA